MNPEYEATIRRRVKLYGEGGYESACGNHRRDLLIELDRTRTKFAALLKAAKRVRQAFRGDGTSTHDAGPALEELCIAVEGEEA